MGTMSVAERLAFVPRLQPDHLASKTESDIIKRAYDIASECGSLPELKRRLILEGYFQVNAHLSGWQIRRDLTQRLNPRLAHQTPERVWERVDR